ncbi:hypothetical protein [Aurantimonas coralicida]|uniref:hypothetical protein n=1 Tax=Aurantimonas coralicida TaxID=182270 RepID=UPI000462ABE9|nr:hypothetical protein [Aurantimonas coralicida]MCC4300117.1 hypothetical protein [Aurantimonas coralicida]
MQLDPVILLHEIRQAQAQAQARLTAVADVTPFAGGDGAKEDVEAFLSGLRHAWMEGEIRPTLRKKLSVPAGAAAPDPLAKVAEDLKEWFHGDPSQTGRELLGRLQTTHPNAYPDRLIRTVQRRVKIRRGDMARLLVFGAKADAQPADDP